MSKRVLITGMTAQHYSPGVVNRTLSFVRAITGVLEERHCSVHISQPSVEWNDFYLKEYDHVFLGIAPPMALSANNVYGALNVLATMKRDKRLTLFIDSPEHWQIFANIRAIVKNPDVLFKEFYSRRSGYHSAARNDKLKRRLIDVVVDLHENQWHRTIYPVLPWTNEQILLTNTPENVKASMIGVLIDAALNAETTFSSRRENKWFVENEKSRWTTNTINSLSFSTYTAKSAKLRDDYEIAKEMSTSAGALIGPSRDNKIWWSPRYAQAMNTGTPVVTDWKESAVLGSSWSHLAVSVEEMSSIDRFELSVTQKKEYYDRIPSSTEVAETLLEQTQG